MTYLDWQFLGGIDGNQGWPFLNDAPLPRVSPWILWALKGWMQFLEGSDSSMEGLSPWVLSKVFSFWMGIGRKGKRTWMGVERAKILVTRDHSPYTKNFLLHNYYHTGKPAPESQHWKASTGKPAPGSQHREVSTGNLIPRGLRREWSQGCHRAWQGSRCELKFPIGGLQVDLIPLIGDVVQTLTSLGLANVVQLIKPWMYVSSVF